MENLGIEIFITTSQRLRITIITNIFFENLREKSKYNVMNAETTVD